MKFYFTFGFGQLHENGFHVIESNDANSARETMVDRFGTKWAFQYTEAEWTEDGVTQQEKDGLREVK